MKSKLLIAIVAILALHLGVDLVAVTTMANLGFHRLMEENGVRVVTTDVGTRCRTCAPSGNKTHEVGQTRSAVFWVLVIAAIFGGRKKPEAAQ